MKYIITSLIFALSFVASAQESTGLTSPANIPMYSHQEARANKTWTLHGQLNVIGQYYSPAIGFAAGYFISPNLILLAEYNDGVGFLDDFKVKTTSLGIKHFVQGMFYYKASLNYSNIEDSSDIFVFTTGSWRYKAQATSLTLNIGFQHQWVNGWTLGADIAGLNIPLSAKYKDEFAANPTELADLKDRQKSDVEELSVNLGWVYLGYSF